ncbi:MAG: hypothetical protein KME11_22115 [Timaviella obliquedivisa GSE-PSE-MK23-08B]|jgi:hypothetical protein|nr:hypothetical protein [Timaviella obliquedivisa GSE-PSE-MK23-08B]
MIKTLVDELHLTGALLFSDSESSSKDLSEEDGAVIADGKRSRSDRPKCT